MPNNIVQAKVYKSLVAWGCEDSWTNSVGFWGQSPARTWCLHRGEGGRVRAAGEMVGPYKHAPFLSLGPPSPWRRAPSLVPDQIQARLSLEKAQLETPETKLWVASGVIWLAKGSTTSLPDHGGFLDGKDPMANDLQSQELFWVIKYSELNSLC